MNDTSPIQILAIDDEPDIVGIVKALLEGEGFTVHTATSPQDGLTLFAQHAAHIKLVLLDYLMPGMKGDVVFERLKRIKPDVKVLLVSAYADQVAKEMEARELRGYLRKPFSLEVLVDRVRQETQAQLTALPECEPSINYSFRPPSAET